MTFCIVLQVSGLKQCLISVDNGDNDFIYFERKQRLMGILCTEQEKSVFLRGATLLHAAATLNHYRVITKRCWVRRVQVKALLMPLTIHLCIVKGLCPRHIPAVKVIVDTESRDSFNDTSQLSYEYSNTYNFANMLLRSILAQKFQFIVRSLS